MADLSHEEIRDLLCVALGEGWWPVSVGDEWVVAHNWQSQAFMRYAYEIEDGKATISGGEEVKEAFVPVRGEMVAESRDILVEAAERGARWLIRVIRSGASENGRLYPPGVLREACGRFEGARVFAVSDRDHIAGAKDVNHLIGRLTAPQFVESAGGGEIRAELGLIEPEGAIGTKLREAWDRGMAGLMGFSIQARGRARQGRIDGRQIHVVESIQEVDSVDLIIDAAAGGELIGLIEAREDPDMKLRERMVKLIETRLGPARLEGVDTNDDEALAVVYREAVAAPDPDTATDPGNAPSAADINRRIDDRIRSSRRAPPRG